MNAILGDEGDVADDEDDGELSLSPLPPLDLSQFAHSPASSSLWIPPMSPSDLRPGRRTIDGPREEEEPHDAGHSHRAYEDDHESFIRRMGSSSPSPCPDGEHDVGQYESDGAYNGYESDFIPSQRPVTADPLDSNPSDSAPAQARARRPSSHLSFQVTTSSENKF
ncbi:hypothetical protein J007_02016 [Cryptococcus neoformans]|nr:hypothetical protein J007_02016 [Cryptococcus neoformans var. grubii]OXC62542.1 hypothetical protein C358_02084 [Cryptococcus neoformans var. grubii MW-RSA852]